MARITRIAKDLVSRPITKKDYKWLYEELKKRPPYRCISHREMPAYQDHCSYWDHIRGWWKTGMVCINGHQTMIPVGYWYLTSNREVGIQVPNEYVGPVLLWLSHIYGSPLRANVAYGDEGRKFLMVRHGWSPVQVTYRIG